MNVRKMKFDTLLTGNMLTAGWCAHGFCLGLASGAHRPLAWHVCGRAQAVSGHAAQPGLAH